MIDEQKNTEQLIEEAAHWIVLLSADDEAEKTAARAEFEAWKSISPQRKKIAQEIEQSLESLQKLTQTPQHQKMTQSVLKAGLQSSSQKKTMRYGSFFAVTLCCLGGIYSYLSYHPIAYLVADLKSQTGEWKTQVLADGSEIKLRAKSAVNLHFTENQRVVELVQGEIYVDVAKDKNRPFIVKTEHGQIEALGTAFSVSYQSDATELKMLHSKVRVDSYHQTVNLATKHPVIVKEGQELRLDRQGIHPIHGFDINREQQKWNQRHLIVENMSLDNVLAELDRSSQSKIVFSGRGLDKIKVNAVLPLDNTENALQLLTSVFPELNVYQVTPYLTIVTLK
ncbi:FecR family protein [Acinetobacter rudis]|uniref:FecR family protein n=1 Tax=Acinetobacter rudis TaxID=632955 RepID=UPI003342A263